jgi:asparagine synthase (glutamine-hydrolysing)
MCGICGVLDFRLSNASPDTIWEMTRTLGHRGPDDMGVHVAPPVLLGHTRLSVIDLSAAGKQPMSSDDGAVTIVYNGEIYNFVELAEELRDAGFRFRGHSDTEVLLSAYLHWGLDCLPRLNGMFAVAIWDSRSTALHLARDRFGIKPLFYHHRDGRLVFGSEIKAILAHDSLERRINWGFLHEYLYYGNSLWEQSAFEGVRKVLPGSVSSFTRAGVAEARYWDIRALRPPQGGLSDLVVGVRERLEASVRRHLRSDVPVAVFLSGGVDSSAVATFGARHYEGRLRTYTAGFDEGMDVDERPKARRLAERLGTEHRELFVRVGDVREVIEALVCAHDEPFADAANIPLYLLSKELEREGVKVVLQGDGGDEIFAGYRRYNVLAHLGFWRLIAGLGLASLERAPKRPVVYRWLRFLRAISQREPALRMALLLTMEDQTSSPLRVLGADARAALVDTDPFRVYREVARSLESFDPLAQMLYADTLVLLADTFLPKVDRSTMAHGVEVRIPFLDAELTDYVIPVASKYKVRRLQKKFLLRKALRGVVPDEILDGRKMGLNVPYSRWLRTRLDGFTRSVLLDSRSAFGDLVDRPALERCIEEHVAGQRDNGFLLYKLLQLALWHRAYLG